MLSNKRILIVEDDADVADVVASYLRSEGYECHVTSDGRSGVEHARISQPDLIVLDRGLPRFSGDEALRELKRDDATASIPIVLLTGKSDESDQLVGFALGADDYVCKPFSAKVLLARVESLLRRAQTAREPFSSISSAPITLDSLHFTACVGEQAVALSKIEFRILATLMAARGHVLDGETLIGLAIDEKGGTSELRIEPHIAALQRKLGPASRCIQEVTGAGYAYCSPDLHATGA